MAALAQRDESERTGKRRCRGGYSMKARIRTFIAVLGVGLLTEFAAIATPPLTESSVTNWQDLGTWDDAYVLDDLDIVVLRRGDAFSMLTVTNAFVASSLANTPAARDSMIVGATHCDGRTWLFLQRP